MKYKTLTREQVRTHLETIDDVGDELGFYSYLAVRPLTDEEKSYYRELVERYNTSVGALYEPQSLQVCEDGVLGWEDNDLMVEMQVYAYEKVMKVLTPGGNVCVLESRVEDGKTVQHVGRVLRSAQHSETTGEYLRVLKAKPLTERGN